MNSLLAFFGMALTAFPGSAQSIPADALVDPNQGGQAVDLRLVEVTFGRLVDVYCLGDPNGLPIFVFSDYLVPDTLLDEPGRWRFERSLASGREQLVIEAPNQPGVLDQFDRLLRAATEGLEVVAANGWEDRPPFSRVPRNAAFSARFDDLIDVSTIVPGESVRVSLDAAGSEVFEARVIADPNFGGVSAIDGTFQPTRILIDLTVEASDDTGGTPLPLQSTGLPAGEPNNAAPDAGIAFPRRANPAAGLFQVLTNLSGASLAEDFNGPTSIGPAGTLELVRAFEVGEQDGPSNGFLPDVLAPELIANNPAGFGLIQPIQGAASSLDFEITTVGLLPSAPFSLNQGDGIRIGESLFAVVLDPGPSVSPAAIFTNVQVRFESAVPASFPQFSLGAVIVRAENLYGLGLEALAVQALPGSTQVGVVQPNSTLTVGFNEPMDAESVRPFDNLTITRVATSPGPFDFVPASVESTGGQTSFRISPTLPFSHQANSEDYFLNVGVSGPGDLTDLAGNPLVDLPGPIAFTIDPNAPIVQNGALTLRFESQDEDGQPGQDLRGQVTYDLFEGILEGRPVQRFPLIVDGTTPVFGSMKQVITGLTTPLSTLGSKTHLMWRYADMGISAGQKIDAFTNLDVEGLALSPFSGSVVQTFFPEFEISLGHSDRLPDEALDPNFFTPENQLSGLFSGSPFSENFLDAPGAGPAVVHPREKGFLVSDLGVFRSVTGTPMLRFPLNEAAGPGEIETYTWRDTEVVERGGFNSQGTETAGPGIPLQREVDVLGLPFEAGSQFGRMGANAKQGIPTVGLPLLIETRCFPTDGVSLNGFLTSIAVTSTPRPFFRAFSTGGFNTQGQAVSKDPDLELIPTGGFNTNPLATQLGAATLPQDPVVYSGQVDFVTRLSRAHTAYLRAPGFVNPDWKAVIVDALGDLPEGTSIRLDFRGHDAAPSPSVPLGDAAFMDVYGDLAEGDLSDDQADFFGFEVTDPLWTDDLDDLDGVQSIQIRITFEGNIESLQTPRLDTLSLVFE